jgi:hypothetical protein
MEGSRVKGRVAVKNNDPSGSFTLLSQIFFYSMLDTVMILVSYIRNKRSRNFLSFKGRLQICEKEVYLTSVNTGIPSKACLLREM